ncbi:SUF system NifU family Fe-S cluster assembly protein [Candidatus Roizmanbacteria bacterium]|nr:SUF system NifU family Fe-S cluster assembly protein [Candidatus Roizmanbacteria bacterium]
MDDLYREIILDHYKNPRNFGSLESKTHEAEANNPFCGDRIRMEILFQKIKRSKDQKIQIIKDIKFSGEGCAISIASASLLTEKVKGMSQQQISSLTKEDIVVMLGIELSPTRLKCALLSLEVLQQTIQ